MAVDDLWYLKKRGPDDERVPAKRHGTGKRYRVRWVDDSGKARTKFFARKVDAERQDANVRADLSRGEYVDPKSGRLSFAKYAEQWQENQVHRGTTRAQVETHMRRHILPYFGKRPLSAIRPTDIQAWVRRMSDDLAPTTVEVVYRFGSAVFKAAVADRLISSSPCVNVKLPKKSPSRVEPLPVALVAALMDAVPARYRALLLVGAAAGLRQGEVLGLEVDRVPFSRPRGATLRVDQQLSWLAGAPPFLAPPKTASSYRTVPIGQVLAGALSAHLAEFPARDIKVVDKTGGKPVTRMARLIFTTEDGKPIDRARFGRMWRPALATACAAYVDAATTPAARSDAAAVAARFAKASFHDLRHFYASLLIAEGSNVTEVQARLGHANASETLNIYTHLWPNSDDRTRDAVDRVLGAEHEAAASGIDQAAARTVQRR